MTDEEQETEFLAMGYVGVRKLPNDRWIGVLPQFYTTALCVGLDAFGYQYRYCYETYNNAIIALFRWDGSGDPPGPWIKLKGHPDRPEELGPGAKGDGI